MGVPKLNEKYTLTAYFALDEKSELGYEYCYGELIPMAGSSLNHNRISRNLCGLLDAKLSANGSHCEPFMSDTRVQVLRQKKYYYPDVVVSCEDMSVQNQKFLISPILIAEVLSDSTANRDINEKMLDYFQVHSLQYYLLISQDVVNVHLYERTDIGWEISLFNKMEEVISFPKLAISIKLEDLYKKVVWEKKEDEIIDEE